MKKIYEEVQWKLLKSSIKYLLMFVKVLDISWFMFWNVWYIFFGGFMDFIQIVIQKDVDNDGTSYEGDTQTSRTKLFLD